MRERKGVLLLMFDLPMSTNDDRREYYHFHKNIRRNGFLQLQESCYLKLIRNTEGMESTIKAIRRILPAQGNVSVLPMTLDDFKHMECLKGDPFNMSLFTDDVFFIGGEDEESA